MSASVDSLLKFTAQELGKRDSKTLLWTNSNPGTWGTDPITVSLSGYDMVEVVFKYKSNESVYFSRCIYNATGNKSTVSNAFGDSGKIVAAYRTWSITSTGLSFNTAYLATTSSDTASTSFMIPYKVYGIKGVV